MNLIGQTFGRYTVIEFSPKVQFGQGTFFVCRCECGRLSTVRGSALRAGSQKACQWCGHTRHGKSRTKEFRIWTNIKYRCTNPDSHAYAKYGGRGIKMCDRWQESFENFLADMGVRPTIKHSLERINNNVGYEPGNCKWALSIDQMNNTSLNRFVTYNGATKTVSQWAREVGLEYMTLLVRLKKGWSPEKALTTPLIDSQFKKGHNSRT